MIVCLFVSCSRGQLSNQKTAAGRALAISSQRQLSCFKEGSSYHITSASPLVWSLVALTPVRGRGAHLPTTRTRVLTLGVWIPKCPRLGSRTTTTPHQTKSSSNNTMQQPPTYVIIETWSTQKPCKSQTRGKIDRC